MLDPVLSEVFVKQLIGTVNADAVEIVIAYQIAYL
jgi:hypothetical protein